MGCQAHGLRHACCRGLPVRTQKTGGGGAAWCSSTREDGWAPTIHSRELGGPPVTHVRSGAEPNPASKSVSRAIQSASGAAGTHAPGVVGQNGPSRFLLEVRVVIIVVVVRGFRAGSRPRH